MDVLYSPQQRVGAVLIGRNEGERLVRALDAAVPRVAAAVYVDSGSTDGSVAAATARGATVVELDPSIPFSAARARNEGAQRLLADHPGLDYIQFIDGDCEIFPAWLESGYRFLEANPRAAAACGRLRERFPERSFYNRLIDLEWDTPVGEALACGGIAMIRAEAFREVGGFDPSVVAGEEPEMCLRLRTRGWTIHRLDAEMAFHDADMHRLAQWWRRDVRTGYGATDLAARFPQVNNGAFVHIVRRARRWAVGYPLGIAGAGVLGALVAGPAAAVGAAGLVSLAGPAQVAKQTLRYRRRGLAMGDAARAGGLNLIGKWAQFLGHLRHLRDRSRHRIPRLIEYKAPGGAPGSGSPA